MKTLLMVLCVFVAGCATLRSDDRYWLKPSVGTVSDEAVSLLYYGNYARELSAAERERELERQRVAYARDKSDFRRIQYALLLLSAHPLGAERRQAAQLIEPVLDGQNHAANLVALAGLIDAQLNGLRRVDELEKKLDAVKDIERSLMQRDTSTVRPSRAVNTNTPASGSLGKARTGEKNTP